MAPQPLSTTQTIGRGIIAGLAGTVIMTAFQEFVEMPLTRRPASFAPAKFAEKMFRVHPTTEQGRNRLNWMTHFALGTMWGAAYGIAARSGLRGQSAVAAVFGVVYTGDVALNTALGLYRPLTWSAKDVAIDVIDKLVQAEATGAIFDRFLVPAQRRDVSNSLLEEVQENRAAADVDGAFAKTDVPSAP